MGYSLELKTSSRQQQTSKVAKEKIISPQANQKLKIRDKGEVVKKDKCKVEVGFGQPYINWHHDIRQKSSGIKQKVWFGSNINKDDELVKYMSNLPSYLQQVEGGEKLQNNALNFGVLDWERLEKWKYCKKRIPARGITKESSCSSSSSFMTSGSCTNSGTAQSKSLASQRKQPPSHGCHLNTPYVRQSRGKDIQLQDFEIAQRSTLGGQQSLQSSGRNYSVVKVDDRGKRKELDQMTRSEKETSLSDWRNRVSPMSSHDIMNSGGGITDMRIVEEFNPRGHQSIALLLPNHSPKKSCAGSFQLSESRTSFDRKLTEANRKRFSHCFSPEDRHSVELYSEIPYSCPLPVRVTTNKKSDVKPHSLINAQGMKLQSDASLKHQYPNEIPIIPSEAKCLEENRSNIESSTSSAIETSKRFYQDVAEQPAVKGRHTSPNRRFSFSLGKMARSLSFKEGSAAPQFSSTYTTVKSGPVRSEASAGSDNFSKDKANASSRAWSSPLRRLLEPLLKPKGAYSAETAQPSKENSKSVSFKPMNTIDLLQNKKHEASSVQALLQLTIKNGLPLFKLVVDSNSDILAAAVKKLPTSEKDDSSLIYAFYSVHEIKKKSGGWIKQGSKEKSCGFGYNIVGQMKVSSSYLPDLVGQNTTNDQHVVREFILYSVDLGQADKETPEFMPKKEVAAIVVKNPSEKTDDGEQSDKSNHYTRKGFTGENENSRSTIVILPGGIHGLPNKGVPSPLITRWRSGGSCDCGGWDVGCKLRILTNKDKSNKMSRPSISCSTTDRLDLFVPDGYQENKPIFSLAPFKNGLYSVEYNASISLLQAFSICIAVITSQKLSYIFEANNLLEAKRFVEPMIGTDMMKTATGVQQEVPPKYVPSPPPSPIGRV